MADKLLSKNNLLLGGTLFSVLTMGGYIWTYQFEPFSDFVNVLITNLLTIIPAVVCAVLISLVASYYEKGEPLRNIWIAYAIAMWMWAIAEVFWSVYNITVGEVPDFSAADVLWMGAYAFLAVALINQFRLVLFDRSNRTIWIGMTVSLVALVVICLITWLTGGSLSDGFSGYFYPVADFAVGLAALILFISFRGGAMAWPWLSLLVFTVSDSLYTWATSAGLYDWSGGGDLLTLMIDLIYVLAYLFMGWGVLSQYMALRFGVSAGKTLPILKNTKPDKPQG